MSVGFQSRGMIASAAYSAGSLGGSVRASRDELVHARHVVQQVLLQLGALGPGRRGGVDHALQLRLGVVGHRELLTSIFTLASSSPGPISSVSVPARRCGGARPSGTARARAVRVAGAEHHVGARVAPVTCVGRDGPCRATIRTPGRGEWVEATFAPVGGPSDSGLK